MTWNYRIFRYRDGDPKFAPYTHGVHETYYDDDGSVYGWTEDAMSLVGYDPDDLEWRLRKMLGAFEKPVLEHEPIRDDPPPL